MCLHSVKINTKGSFFQFLQVSHLFLHRIVGIFSFKYTKRSTQNTVHWPVLDSFMYNNVILVTSTSPGDSGKFGPMTSSRDVIKNAYLA